jgi:hypothetical protein
MGVRPKEKTMGRKDERGYAVFKERIFLEKRKEGERESQ